MAARFRQVKSKAWAARRSNILSNMRAIVLFFFAALGRLCVYISMQLCPFIFYVLLVFSSIQYSCIVPTAADCDKLSPQDWIWMDLGTNVSSMNFPRSCLGASHSLWPSRTFPQLSFPGSRSCGTFSLYSMVMVHSSATAVGFSSNCPEVNWQMAKRWFRIARCRACSCAISSLGLSPRLKEAWRANLPLHLFWNDLDIVHTLLLWQEHSLKSYHLKCFGGSRRHEFHEGPSRLHVPCATECHPSIA